MNWSAEFWTTFYERHLKQVRKYHPHYSSGDINIVDSGWDYLIVLDACRFDYFKKYSDISGELTCKISNASKTSEWLRNNFPNKYDIVYVSANPHISDRLVDDFCGTDHFYKVLNVWRHNWDDELDTVLPGKVTEACLRALNNFPKKRMIIHYIQPHGPWIGNTKLETKVSPAYDATNTNEDFNSERWNHDTKVWQLVKRGEISIDNVRKAYRDNLKLVLDEVKKLLEYLNGNIVITADHGESLGEYFIFEHPPKIYTPQVVEIPWLRIKKDHKKNLPRLEDEENVKYDNEKNEQFEGKLKSLGYL